MRVLIIKTSSMGDILHTLPALTDAGQAIPQIRFDWVVEEGFQAIPTWHPLVNKVIPIAWRRWRKQLFAKTTRNEWHAFITNLRQEQYDLVIDAQGLLKSAIITWLTRSKSYGLDRRSARESLSAFFYQHKIKVSWEQHAVARVRDLFSQALGYANPQTPPHYGMIRNELTQKTNPYLVFLHGTTWATKHWPENYWVELVKLAEEAGFKIQLPWGNPEELARAKRIAGQTKAAEVLPKMNLQDMVSVLAGSTGVVAVDTGLCHLAAALNVPTVSLYGPTDPKRTGALGVNQVHLSTDFSCAPCLRRNCSYKPNKNPFPPCFITLSPARIWTTLRSIISRSQD